MFDVFYFDKKPNLFPHEQHATDIDHARQLSRTRFFWIVTYLADYSNFDFLWEPVPWQQRQRHAWASQWQKDSGTYLVPKVGYIDTNYHAQPVVTRLPCMDSWDIAPDVVDFDYSWHPDPADPPYIHVFGTKYYNEGGPKYCVPGAVNLKYVESPQAQMSTVSDCWKKFYTVEEFDWSWRPHPQDPPFVYVFGNQWHRPEIMPTVEYCVEGAVNRKFMPMVARLPARPNDSGWTKFVDCDFDWSWIPDPGDPPYIYVFGNQWWSAEKMPTVEYRVAGATDKKYMSWPKATLPAQPEYWHVPDTVDPGTVDTSWVPDPGAPPYIYQFATQWQPTGGPRFNMPGATEISYVSYFKVKKTTVDPHWEVPQDIDVEDFDFTWHPNENDPPYIYQFGTQHQKTGGPRYVVPGAEEVKYVSQIRVKTKQDAVPVYEIDHLDGNAGQIPNTVKRIRYFDNYRDTLIRLAKSLPPEQEFAWVCSSICDYSQFDFSWHPEQWQLHMLHVFASNDQKFGDTFFMHVPSFVERIEKSQLLEWYDVNYVQGVSVPRRPMPVFYHQEDSHVDVVKHTEFTAPLALFTVEEHIDCATTTVPLWRQEVKTITPISHGATAVIVPKAAVGDIQTQLYDYPNIDKTKTMLNSEPLDIVFIANGEPCANRHFDHLNSATYNLRNRLHRIDGVNGRVAAYHAAAQVSKTPWFFAVFAKLEVETQFDWAWQPDRMQQAKHYIFHAVNPINGLTYGHQAMIAYNRRLTLANAGEGLDFTLDSPHEVVPIVSGTAFYTATPWMAWRTAFREALKLQASLPDVENEYRLEQWLTVDNSPEQWSSRGAQDAVDYYKEVGGDFAALKKSYDLDWLASYAMLKRGLAPGQRYTRPPGQ